MRHRIAIVFFVAGAVLSCLGSATGEETENEAALKVMDAVYHRHVAADTPKKDRDGALTFLRGVIDRIDKSHLFYVELRVMAQFAAIAMRKASAGPGKTEPARLAGAGVEAALDRLADTYASFTPRGKPLRRRRRGGIGIEAAMVEGQLREIAPLAGGPAARAGIRPGDLIVEIDHKSSPGSTLAKAMAPLFGPLGSEVHLNIRRGTEPRFSRRVTRARFRVQAVRHEIFGRIGYIRIATFAPSTEKLLRKSILAIKAQLKNGAAGYILDLRDNPGGLVGQAILAADAFLIDGMIVETRGRSRKGSRRYKAYRGDYVEGKPIVVLVNRGSASAAEILAAALKDNRRAVLMGTRSFGKGVVQTAFPFGRWGEIRFTTHKYMSASGLQIHGIGVKPDIYVSPGAKRRVRGHAIDSRRCPPIGPAKDKTLGCAVSMMKTGALEQFLARRPPRAR